MSTLNQVGRSVPGLRRCFFIIVTACLTSSGWVERAVAQVDCSDPRTIFVIPFPCVKPPSQTTEALRAIGLKWACIEGAPACDNPSLVNENDNSFKSMLWRRHERASDCILIPQCNITARSAALANGDLRDSFVKLPDFGNDVGDPGDVVLSIVDPGEMADQSEVIQTWDAAAQAWGETNSGIVAVSVNKIINAQGNRIARALVIQNPDTGDETGGTMVTTPWLLVQDPTHMCEANERTLAKMLGSLMSLSKRDGDPLNLMSRPNINEDQSGILLTAAQCVRARAFLDTPEGAVLDFVPPGTGGQAGLVAADDEPRIFADQVYDGLEESVPDDEKYLDVLNSVVIDSGANQGRIVFCSAMGGQLDAEGPQGETNPICVAFAMDCDNNVNTGDNAGEVVPGADFPGAEFVAELLVDRQTGQVIPVLNAATGFGFIEIEFEPGVFEGDSQIGFIRVVEPTPAYDGPEFIPLTTEVRATLDSQLFADALADMGIEADETGRTFPVGLRFQVTTSQGDGRQVVDSNPQDKLVLDFEDRIVPQVVAPRRVAPGETVRVRVTNMPQLMTLRTFTGGFNVSTPEVVTDANGSAEFDMTIPADAPLGTSLLTIGVDDENNAVTADGVIRVVACPPDLDGSGGATIFDFLAFQNAWQAGQLDADFDGDGELTVFDFLAFQNAFELGCP